MPNPKRRSIGRPPEKLSFDDYGVELVASYGYGYADLFFTDKEEGCGDPWCCLTYIKERQGIESVEDHLNLRVA